MCLKKKKKKNHLHKYSQSIFVISWDLLCKEKAHRTKSMRLLDFLPSSEG